MKKVIMKFGGTSVATGEKIKNLARLVADYARQDYTIAIVVSALDGITEQLIEATEKAEKGKADFIHLFKQQILERHFKAAKVAIENKKILKEIQDVIQAIVDELEKVLIGICYLKELTPKSSDYVLSFGERLAAPIVYGALRDVRLKTQYFSGKEAGIVTDSNFGEASPLMDVTTHQLKERIEPLLEDRIIPVVTGFIAATQEGVITTLGRGGSDQTGTILGAALAADEIWIWTDVDGLMTADPRIVPNAKLLHELSYQEAAEMAIFGAKAMHPKALEPAVKSEIPVRIRNVTNPGSPGTLIWKNHVADKAQVVKAVALIGDVAMINVTGSGMVGVPGSYAKILEVLGKNSINVMMISTAVSEANISFIIRRNLLERALSTLEIALLGKNAFTQVSYEDDVCVIATMGAQMKGTKGVASRIFTAVAKRGINVRMIAQGSSELNISFVVKEEDGEETVRAIHEEFELYEN